jgi:hypothetical protein
MLQAGLAVRLQVGTPLAAVALLACMELDTLAVKVLA